MGRYIVRRFIFLFAVLLVTSLITFVLMHEVPGGPFDTDKKLPAATIAMLEKHYRLDLPLYQQYLQYLDDVALPHFSTIKPSTTDLSQDFLITFNVGGLWVQWMNFGPSITSRTRTVNDIFRQQLPVSFQLGTMSLIVALIIGMPLGVLAALKQNTVLDYVGMSIAIVGVSVTSITLGPLMIWIFGVWLKVLPPSGWGAEPPYILGFIPSNLGWDYFKYAIMPSIVLGFGSAAVIARLARASLLQTIREDYIRTARSKGLQETLVITRHALKNSLIPVVTMLGPMFAALVTGTFVTERIFAIPGLGRYFVNSISNRDYPVIMGTVLLYAVFLVMSNLVVDIVYAYLDPRIRYE